MLPVGDRSTRRRTGPAAEAGVLAVSLQSFRPGSDRPDPCERGVSLLSRFGAAYWAAAPHLAYLFSRAFGTRTTPARLRRGGYPSPTVRLSQRSSAPQRRHP